MVLSMESATTGAYSDGVLHLLLREGRVDDEAAVVRHNGAGLHFRHAQCGVRRAEGFKPAQHLAVREGDNFDWDALLPLKHQLR